MGTVYNSSYVCAIIDDYCFDILAYTHEALWFVQGQQLLSICVSAVTAQRF